MRKPLSLGNKMLLIVASACILLTAAIMFFSYNSNNGAEKSAYSALSDSLQNTADNAAAAIDAKIQGIELAAGEASEYAALKSSPNEIKRMVLAVKNNFYQNYGVYFDYAIDGTGVNDGKDYSENSAYKSSLELGKSLEFNTSDNSVYFAYADKSNGRVVICKIEDSYFSDALNADDNLYCELRTADGKALFTYGNKKIMDVGEKYLCTAESALSNSMLSIFAVADSSEYIVSTETNPILPLIAAVVIMAAAMFAAYAAVGGSFTEIKKLTLRIKKMSEGDFTSPVEPVGNEFGDLSENVNQLAVSVNNSISKICEGVEQKKSVQLSGDFNKVQPALRKLCDDNKKSIAVTTVAPKIIQKNSAADIRAAEKITAAVKENAASVAKITQQMAGFSQMYENVSFKADKAAKKIQAAEKIIAEEKAGMDKLVQAVSEISSQSQSVKKVIADIEDIAFQTNILALNAAVEAARAGESGKGFAIVAEEVRNLAAKSSKSAEVTSQIIENMLTSAKIGTSLVDENAKMIENAVEASEEAAETVQQIDSGMMEKLEDFKVLHEKMTQLETNLNKLSNAADEHRASLKK